MVDRLRRKDGWYPGKFLSNATSGRSRRVTPSSDEQGEIDEVVMTDVAEQGPLYEITASTRPATGRSFQGQTEESYCMECIEGHTMTALTEMRHALDRYRTANAMVPGVTEKVRVALQELMGIEEDAVNTAKADPLVKKGIDEILEEVRWIRKEYGLSGRGLTTGYGTMADLEELRSRIHALQTKAYALVKICPTCNPRIQTAMGKIMEKRDAGGS